MTDNPSLVERLRHVGEKHGLMYHDLETVEEAATELDRLERELAERTRERDASDILLLLDWSLEDAIIQHGNGEIGKAAEAVLQRYPSDINTKAIRDTIMRHRAAQAKDKSNG